MRLAQELEYRCTIPELNPAMDVYRVGTLLELAREIATTLAQDGAHVKICVQQSLGVGVFQVVTVCACCTVLSQWQ